MSDAPRGPSPTERQQACAAKREGEGCAVHAEEHICVRQAATLICLPATSMEIDVARLHAKRVELRDVAIGAGAIGMLAATVFACARYSSGERLRWARTNPVFAGAWLAFCVGLTGAIAATGMPSAPVTGPARVVYRTSGASEATGCPLSFGSRIPDLNKDATLVEFMSGGEGDRARAFAAIRLSWRKWRVVAMDPNNLEIDWHIGPCSLHLDVVDDRVLVGTHTGVGILDTTGTSINAWRYRDDDATAWLLDRERLVARTEEGRNVVILIDQGDIIDPAIASAPLRGKRERWLWDGPVGSAQGLDFIMKSTVAILEARRDGRAVWERPANAALLTGGTLYLCSATPPACARVDPKTGETLARAPWRVLAVDGESREQ